MWEHYSTRIILTACVVFLSQTASIGWLIYEHHRRQLAEVQARNAMAELTQLNRLATAGELSAAIAHEVKQPLTGILTMANAAIRRLSRENPDIGRARDALDQVVVAGHRANDVITSVSAMFRKDKQEKRPSDLNKLLRTVLGLVYFDLRKHSIETQVNLSEQLPPVFGNEVQLQQVILNLMMNAVEAMVSAAEPRVLVIKSESGHNTVLVSISDTGVELVWPISVAFLNQCSRPKHAGWEWVSRSVSRLSKATMVRYGCRLVRPEARFFILHCRCTEAMSVATAR